MGRCTLVLLLRKREFTAWPVPRQLQTVLSLVEVSGESFREYGNHRKQRAEGQRIQMNQEPDLIHSVSREKYSVA